MAAPRTSSVRLDTTVLCKYIRSEKEIISNRVISVKTKVEILSSDCHASQSVGSGEIVGRVIVTASVVNFTRTKSYLER